jgi:signal recognition particle subunit SRP54
MANRILGMGDIVSLVEEAHKVVDQAEAEKLAAKLKAGNRFDLNDFASQLGQMSRMGGLSGMLDKLPAQFQQAAAGADMSKAEKQVRRMQAIISSMTPGERGKPELIKASRKRRIAAGAGVPVQEVNRLLTQFDQMQSMMRKMQKGGLAKMMRGMKGMLPGMR